MIRVLADGVVVYDSRLEDYKLLGLTITTGLNKAGTASIVMPPGHPAYNQFTSYRTVIEVYRDNALLFRGRVLYPTDDFYNRRTLTCEGELNFFRDGIARPYLYQDSPAAIFSQVVDLYNAQVEKFKQFTVGTVTVTDPNNYIRLESESAEPFSDTINKLLERCGGYLVFTSEPLKGRVISWYADLDYRSNQVVEFGENLLSFSRTGANTDMATVVIPYGAKDETTGQRVTIESVNDGLDFIQDYDAVALRGVIAQAVYWDDVAEPANLLIKAQQYLESKKNAVTTLELSAVDLSLLDSSIDRYQVGDWIRVRSKPHGLDDMFQLTERTENLLNPADSAITLGRDTTTLTGADAAGDRSASAGIARVETNVKADISGSLSAAIEETKLSLSTLIQQTAESIQTEVAEQYATNDSVRRAISTSMTQLADQFEFLFTELQTVVDSNDSEAREQFLEIKKYIRFEDGNIILGENGNELTLRIQNDRISFLDAGAEVAYFSNQRLNVTDGTFLHSLRVGNIAALPRANGNLSIVRVVE